MDYTYSEVFILIPNNVLLDVREFPTVELATKFCNRNEFGKYIVEESSNKFLVYVDYNNEISEFHSKDSQGVIYALKKNTNEIYTQSKEKINVVNNPYGVLNIEDVNKLSKDSQTNVRLFVEKDANCIMTILKCEDKKDRVGMNINNSKLIKVIFSENPYINLNDLNLDKGMYIFRLMFYIKIDKDMDMSLGFVFPDSQISLYLDGMLLQTAGNSKQPYIMRDINVNAGVHSIFIDFSLDFDSNLYSASLNKLLIPDSEEELSAVPLIKTEDTGDEFKVLNTSNYVYINNPDLLRTEYDIVKDKLVSSICGVKNFYTNLECLTELNNGLDVKLSEKLKKQFADEFKLCTEGDSCEDSDIDSLINVIKFIYEDNDIDYDTARYMKTKIESYFIKKFIDMSWKEKDIKMFSFLVPVLSKLYHTFVLSSDVKKACSDVESELYKTGFCDVIESDIYIISNDDTKKEINDIVDRRDYIKCLTFDNNTKLYNFELDENRDRCDGLIFSNTNKTIKDYLLTSKCSTIDDKWTGDNRCKEQSRDLSGSISKQRDNYYRNIFSSKENIEKFLKGDEVESLSDFLNYTADSDNIGGDFILTEELANLCENAESDDLISKCKQIYNSGIIIRGVNTNAQLNDIYRASVKKIKSNKCEKELNQSLDNNTKIVCEDMFDVSDELNAILYSNHVKKYCSRRAFDDKCIQYYEDVLNKLRDGDAVEGFSDRGYIKSDYLLIILLLILVTAFVFFLKTTFFKDKEAKLNTRLNDNTATKTNTIEKI